MLFKFNNQEVKQITFDDNAVNFVTAEILTNGNTNGSVVVWANIPDTPVPSHSSVTTSSVVISWTAVDRANNYTVLLGGSTYSTSSTQITINNLSQNTSFNYQVKANGDGGSSEYSTAKSFTTSQVSLATPSVSTSKTTSSVTLSWSAISNATQYRIVFNGTTYTQTGTSRTISGLSHNTTYSWQVRAEDTSGSGSSRYASSSYRTGSTTTSQLPKYPAPVINSVTNHVGGTGNFTVNFNNAAYKSYTIEAEVTSSVLNLTKTYTQNYSSSSASTQNFVKDLWSDFGGLSVQVKLRFKNISNYRDSDYSNIANGKVPIKKPDLVIVPGENLVRLSHPEVPNHGRTTVFARFGRSTTSDSWNDEDNWLQWNPTTLQGASSDASDFSVEATYAELRQRDANFNPWYFQGKFTVESGELPNTFYGDFANIIAVNTIPSQEITIHGYVSDDGDDYQSIYYTAQKTETVILYESNINRGTFEMKAGTWVVYLDNGDDYKRNNHLSDYGLPSSHQYYIANNVTNVGYLDAPKFQGLDSGTFSNVGVQIARIRDDRDGD